MSLSTALFCIKGQHIDKLSEIFSFFKLNDTGKDIILGDWDEAIEIMDKEFMNPDETSQCRVAWYDNGWTVIEDLSLVLCTDEQRLKEISFHFSTQVFSLVTQGTSGCYAFWYYNQEKLRSFFNNNGNVIDNFGKPLPEEANYNINEKAFYDDIHGVAKQFGIDFGNASVITNFIAKRLENNEELNEELRKLSENIKPQPAYQHTRKPWWKFW
jgi:hypothetical protein